MRKQIRSLDVVSAGKVGCLVGTLLAAILGCFTVFLPFLLLPSMMATMMPDSESALTVMGGGFIGALGAYLVTIIFQGFFLALTAVLGALLYNLVAGWVGGLVVDLQDE